jgi:hypothetical protein
VTFFDSPSRIVDHVRAYIQEYLQYNRSPDLDDAFLNDEGYCDEYTTKIAIPLGLIDVGEEFHICFEDVRLNTNIGCFEMKNTEKKGHEEFRFIPQDSSSFVAKISFQGGYPQNSI